MVRRNWSPDQTLRLLVLISLVFATISPLSYAIDDTSPWVWLHYFFRLDDEWSLPKWYAVALLSAAALLLVTITGEGMRAGRKDTAQWGLLATMFALMAVDETFGVHEAVGNALQSRYQLRGFFRFGWVIPASVGVLVYSAYVARFLLSLHPGARWRLTLGLGVYVAGALGLEMITGAAMPPGAIDKLAWPYILLSTAEETLEMLGASLVVAALLFVLQEQRAALMPWPDLREPVTAPAPRGRQSKHG